MVFIVNTKNDIVLGCFSVISYILVNNWLSLPFPIILKLLCLYVNPTFHLFLICLSHQYSSIKSPTLIVLQVEEIAEVEGAVSDIKGVDEIELSEVQRRKYRKVS